MLKRWRLKEKKSEKNSEKLAFPAQVANQNT